MKNLFLILLTALIAFTQFVGGRQKAPSASGGVPILYWNADLNPTRLRTVEIYHQWLAKHGYPAMELRIDPYNFGLQKIIMQGASGVGADVMVEFGWNLQYLDRIGLIENLSPHLASLPTPAVHHDPRVSNDLFRDGRRIAMSVNCGASFFFVNRDAFRGLGLPPAPQRWTLDEFEALGREYVARANSGKGPRRFFADKVDRETLRRSIGLSFFDETLSGPVLDTEAHVRLLERMLRWIRVDRILPTQADVESMSTAASADQGNWAGYASLFHRGYWALTFTARPMLIGLRQLSPPVDMAISESPHGGYPNCVTRTFVAAMSAGSKKKDLARHFMLFMLSEEHNAWIITNGDQMPPLPASRARADFRRPSAWTNEWDVHGAIAERFEKIGIGSEYSPFVPWKDCQRADARAWDLYLSGLIDARGAVRQMQADLENEIQRAIKRDPRLAREYRAARAVQAELDDLKKQGKPLPLSKVANPFLRRYEQDLGKGI